MLAEHDAMTEGVFDRKASVCLFTKVSRIQRERKREKEGEREKESACISHL